MRSSSLALALALTTGAWLHVAAVLLHQHQCPCSFTVRSSAIQHDDKRRRRSVVMSRAPQHPELLEAMALSQAGKQPRHRVIFMRHGESVYNAEGRFIGWADPPLSPRGEEEARRAALLLAEYGVADAINEIVVSYLRRTIKTGWIIADALGRPHLPVTADWRLNEQRLCYGVIALPQTAVAAIDLELACMRDNPWDAVTGHGTPNFAEWADYVGVPNTAPEVVVYVRSFVVAIILLVTALTAALIFIVYERRPRLLFGAPRPARASGGGAAPSARRGLLAEMVRDEGDMYDNDPYQPLVSSSGP